MWLSLLRWLCASVVAYTHRVVCPKEQYMGKSWSILAAILILCPTVARAVEFPLRATYPDVTTISTADLMSQYASSTIVDTRSEVEFSIIHIAKALHVPVSKPHFIATLEAQVPKDVSVVFYCNGHQCAKSYKAARKAQNAGYVRAMAYDVGIYEWASVHAHETVLLGDSPADLSKLISDDRFLSKQLEARVFVRAASKPGSWIIDAREPSQRKRTPTFSGKPVVNYFMPHLVKLLKQPSFKKRANGRTLYIFDATGKQIRWLQYYLERYGYRDYSFLKGGVWSLFGIEGANKVTH